MPRPNLIVILTDDQGYGDLSCMGAPDLRTPHLDRLATPGVRFTNWYSNSPMCSPSRAALPTGRYPGVAGVRAILAGHRTATGLPSEVPTLATALCMRGYRTALIGKWHLGLAPGCRPNEGEVYENGTYLTELVTQRAVDYVRESAQGLQPFLMFVGFSAPHYPVHAPRAYLDRVRGLAPDRRIMAAMLGAMDDGVGAILAELGRQEIALDAAVFLMWDNGPSRETRNWLDGRPDPYYGGTSGQLKGHPALTAVCCGRWMRRLLYAVAGGNPCSTANSWRALRRRTTCTSRMWRPTWASASTCAAISRRS
jgi:arylsulfatase A-like enzyme